MSKIRNDIILAAVLLLLSVAGLLLYKGLQQDGNYAIVLVDGEKTASFTLSRDTEYIINANGGVNTLVIKDGKADIISADCPDGICTEHAPISKTGETITCLPHGVVVKIESGNKNANEIDMVA